MSRNSFVLFSTTAIAAALFATPAFAQDVPPPPPPNPDAAATQGTPAASSDTGPEIVVTGLRRSLQSAQNIKRSSVQIVDAVVAEDIGKLPDITVSETAARIQGIQV
jgi:hypothetical protein